MSPSEGRSAAARRWILCGTAILGICIGWVAQSQSPVSAMRGDKNHSRASLTPSQGAHWVYGRADARFTLTEYADLECPYCREYFPVLRHWIDAHPDVNWQWHHLPLSIHEPAASHSARLAECAGETDGNAAFWDTIDWIYRNTQGDGAGLPANLHLPHNSRAVQECMASTRPETTILAQAELAAREHITATPTLRLQDRQSTKTLMFYGPIDGDALLSAFDELVAPPTELAQDSHAP